MIDYDKGLYYGYPEKELTLEQIMKAIKFNIRTQPWLEENIGKFGDAWFVALDKEENSLRLLFKNKTDEVIFKLAWMQGVMVEDAIANQVT